MTTTNKTIFIIEDSGQVSFVNFRAAMCVDKVTEKYWKLVENLVDGVGLVEGRKKLRDNFKDPATQFKVQDVLDKYYDGRIDRLEASIRKQIKKNRATLGGINRILEQTELGPIRNKNILALFLQDSTNRRKLKRIAEQNRKSAILSLDDIVERYE